MADFPGKELISVLEELRQRLNISGVERTNGLCEKMGNDCTYYRKSLDIFLKKDLDDLQNLISRANSLISQLK
jgi:hypothetical protein